MTDGPTDAMVVEVWERVRPSAAQKVAVVASASSRLANDQLDESLRAEAWQQSRDREAEDAARAVAAAEPLTVLSYNVWFEVRADRALTLP